MKEYRVFYIGIGGIERYAIIEAHTPFEARDEFKKRYWAYHEILDVEEVRK